MINDQMDLADPLVCKDTLPYCKPPPPPPPPPPPVNTKKEKRAKEKEEAIEKAKTVFKGMDPTTASTTLLVLFSY